MNRQKIRCEEKNPIVKKNEGKNLLQGTVIIESTGDLDTLRQRLERLLYWSCSAETPVQIQVVCKAKVYHQVEHFLQQYYHAVLLSVLPDESGEKIGLKLLKKVPGDKVAFMPEDSAFCSPDWEALDRVPDSIIPMVGHVEYPAETAWIRQKKADGWLCRTRIAIKLLASTTSLEEWKAAEIFKNCKVSVLSPPPLIPSTDDSPAKITVKKENTSPITFQSKVMVIAPYYKCEEWLSRCLESLVTQTRLPDAVVVVDDNSQQPPIDIVKQFPLVTLMTTGENVGPYRIIQQVIENTDFDAYMFQDADDWSSMDRLELLLKEAERTGAQLVGSQELRVICPAGFPGIHQLQPVCYPLDVNRALKEKPGHGLLHPTSIVSRDLIRRVGGFATGLRFGGDTEFLLRAVYLAPIVNIPRFCYYRRHRPGSLTTNPHSGLNSPIRKELFDILKNRARENMRRLKNGQSLLLKPLKLRPPVELKYLCGPDCNISGPLN
jgi:glycosyltransferase involved in cell wall biosynthesis